MSPVDLDVLMGNLVVRFLGLTECLVTAGHALQMGGARSPGIHYNVQGKGRIFVGRAPPIDLIPHTLIIVPPNAPFRIEVEPAGGTSRALKPVDGRLQTVTKGMRRVVAGDGKPEIILICGFFHAAYGAAVDLFGALGTPIVEQFAASDRLDYSLRTALNELVAQEAG